MIHVRIALQTLSGTLHASSCGRWPLLLHKVAVFLKRSGHKDVLVQVTFIHGNVWRVLLHRVIPSANLILAEGACLVLDHKSASFGHGKILGLDRD